MIRPAGPQDVPFMRDMLRHAYYWRVDRVPESGEPPVRRYVERWGRPGDTALVAIQDFQTVGAAWYRLFPRTIRLRLRGRGDAGAVDRDRPEQARQRARLGAAGRPASRGRRADGHAAISLSVEAGSPAVGLYERHGFARVGEDDGGVTMRPTCS